MVILEIYMHLKKIAILYMETFCQDTLQVTYAGIQSGETCPTTKKGSQCPDAWQQPKSYNQHCALDSDIESQAEQLVQQDDKEIACKIKLGKF